MVVDNGLVHGPRGVDHHGEVVLMLSGREDACGPHEQIQGYAPMKVGTSTRTSASVGRSHRAWARTTTMPAAVRSSTVSTPGPAIRRRPHVLDDLPVHLERDGLRTGVAIIMPLRGRLVKVLVGPVL
jgi:hypothetical protein